MTEEIAFAKLKEGERFKSLKTRSVYLKESDLVSNAVSLTGVRVRFKPSELVIRIVV
jgi:hypothetical protein